jgi:hypothetical protein
MEDIKNNPSYKLVELFANTFKKHWQDIAENPSQLKVSKTKDLEDSTEGNSTLLKSYKLANASTKDESFVSLVEAINTTFWFIGQRYVPNSRMGNWYWKTKTVRVPKVVKGAGPAIEKVHEVLPDLSQTDFFIVMSGADKGYNVTFSFRKKMGSIFFDFTVKRIDGDVVTEAETDEDGYEDILSESSSSVRPLYEIAKEIKKNWPNVNYAAKPYLDAMMELNSIKDKYMYEDAKSIVLYFLSNAATWRGPDAKRIKDELKTMVKSK